MAIGREDYEERRQARIDRLEERAEAAEKESHDAYDRASAIADRIPMGQPILVGHHSERHARRDQANIERNMDKSVAADKKAKYYAGRAQAAAENTAISSDDPHAPEKLTAKIADLRARLERMKAINKYYRKHGTCVGFEGLSDERAREIENSIQYHSWAPVPYPDFELSSVRQRIKAAEQRLTRLQVIDQMDDRDVPFSGGVIRVNNDINRVQILFDERPYAAMIEKLKGAGFRWAPSEKAWQRQKSPSALYAAERVVGVK